MRAVAIRRITRENKGSDAVLFTAAQYNTDRYLNMNIYNLGDVEKDNSPGPLPGNLLETMTTISEVYDRPLDNEYTLSRKARLQPGSVLTWRPPLFNPSIVSVAFHFF